MEIAASVSMRPMVTTLLDSINKHLSDHRRGEVIREGIQVKGRNNNELYERGDYDEGLG